MAKIVTMMTEMKIMIVTMIAMTEQRNEANRIALLRLVVELSTTNPRRPHPLKRFVPATSPPSVLLNHF